MGDRCYLEVVIQKKDNPIWLSVLRTPGLEAYFDSVDINDQKPGALTCVSQEANYALYSELEAAANQGAKFYGSHGAGGDYGPCRFIAHRRKVLYADETTDGRLMVEVDETGAPVKQDLARMARFCKLYAKAQS